MITKKLFIIVLTMLFLIGSCSTEETESSEEETTGSDTQEGTPEACGNGICDSIEKEKGLCSTDCDESQNEQETQTAEQQKSDEEISETKEVETTEIETDIDAATAKEILEAALDAYGSIEELLIELQTMVASASVADEEEKKEIQKEIDGTITAINALSDTAKSNNVHVLQGTNQEVFSALEDYRSAGTPWQRITDAVNALEEGNQEVTFTYSFIIEGTEMENGESMELKDYESDDVSNEEFKQDIREGITAWEKLFEDVFNTAHGYGGNLEIIFTDLGDETGTSTGSYADVEVYEIPSSENLGDLRYGMEYYDSMVTGTPFSPTGKPTEGEESDSSGDVHYNSNIGWRVDSSSESATSVMIVTAHETGHGLAYQHLDAGLMEPSNIVRGSFRELFPNGLIDDEGVVAATITMYGAQAETTMQKIMLDKTEIELPAVNAATLGVSAIKIRTDDEIEAAKEKVESAISILEEHKKNVEELQEAIG